MREVVKNRSVVDPTSTRSLGDQQGFVDDGNKQRPLTVAEVMSLAVVALLALMGLGPVLLVLPFP